MIKFSKLLDGLRLKAEGLTARIIGLKFRYGPIYIPVGPKNFEPVWLTSVTFRRDPEGTRFFLRCTDNPKMELGKNSGPVKLRVLDYQHIVSEKGRWVYRKPEDDDSSTNYSKPEHSNRGHFSGGLGRQPPI